LSSSAQTAGTPPASPPLLPAAREFAPGLNAIQDMPPSRLAKATGRLVMALSLLLIIWAAFGKLDIVVSASGHLVPQSYVKIVQPADGGMVSEILVKEGDQVQAGQVLLRLDAHDAQADESSVDGQRARRELQLRRIDAELSGRDLAADRGDDAVLFRQVHAQFEDRRRAHADAVGQAEASLDHARRDLEAGSENLAKLKEVEPILKQEAQAWASMGKDGYVPRVQVQDKQREYLEKARDLAAQASTVASLQAAVNSARAQLAQIQSKYRSDLQNERADAEDQYRRLQQELSKQTRKRALTELRAPQAGVVKDLATHTNGTVVSAGTVLLSLVPSSERLVAEVQIGNDDVAFVKPGQHVKIKVAAYPFQEYGMLDGEVENVSADANVDPNASGAAARDRTSPPMFYKARVAFPDQRLSMNRQTFGLVAGMQVVAEISEGRRSVMQYLLSPIQKAVSESGRER
jgi:hemolysin D